MKNNTHQLALFGDPVSHSLSPQIHQNFALQFDLLINYRLIQVSAELFPQAVSDFFQSGGKGANVTLPHKLKALHVVNDMSAVARKAQAINTLSSKRECGLFGDNTDGIGLVHDLIKRCHFNCKNKRILILGAGGATQGIVPEIMNAQPRKLVIANRSLNKAKNIACYENASAITFDKLAELNQSFDLIVHASSLGHKGQTLEFQKQHLHAHTIGYDLSYAKAALPFMELCRCMGVRCIFDGKGMLIEQAASAFEVWFGVKPDTQLIRV